MKPNRAIYGPIEKRKRGTTQNARGRPRAGLAYTGGDNAGDAARDGMPCRERGTLSRKGVSRTMHAHRGIWAFLYQYRGLSAIRNRAFCAFLHAFCVQFCGLSAGLLRVISVVLRFC